MAEGDEKREATLKKLAEGLPLHSSTHAETAWHLVRGEEGFEEDSEANRAYVTGKWAAIRGPVAERQQKEEKEGKGHEQGRAVEAGRGQEKGH